MQNYTLTIADTPLLSSVPTALPSPAGVGQAVSFTATVTDVFALNYSWDFGDGSAGGHGRQRDYYTPIPQWAPTRPRSP